MLMDARAPEQIKNPYIAALIAAYVGIFRLELLSISEQQKYWNFIRSETLLETNVLHKSTQLWAFSLLQKLNKINFQRLGY